MTIAFADWQDYTWKNELLQHAERVSVHLSEVIDSEYEGAHNPHHMLERALTLAAFCVRRMHEKRLVTDTFREEKVPVRTFAANIGPNFRHPFMSSSGSDVFRDYDLEKPVMVQLRREDVANQIIHSSQLMVCYGQPGIEDGLMIASDRGLKVRLLHLTDAEWVGYYKAVLDNYVTLQETHGTPRPAMSPTPVARNPTAEAGRQRTRSWTARQGYPRRSSVEGARRGSPTGIGWGRLSHD